MRRLVLFLALAGSCGAASAASGSSTITFASDYLFDGVSQTQGDSGSDFNPALQASFDLEFESGFYAGIWASNVDFGSEDPADTEIDYYIGFAGETESGWGWDVGALYYTYAGAPSDGYDYGELMLAVTAPFGTTASIYAGDSDDVFGGSFQRFKLQHSIALNDTWSLDLEATRSHYSDSEAEDYTHGQIGVSRDIGPFSAYFGYADTDLDDTPNAEGRFLFTLSTTVDLF